MVLSNCAQAYDSEKDRLQRRISNRYEVLSRLKFGFDDQQMGKKSEQENKKPIKL